MRTLGKLLVIWGVLLPLIGFPWMKGLIPEKGVLGSLQGMFVTIDGTHYMYKHLATAGLVLVGLGLSLLAFCGPRERARQRTSSLSARSHCTLAELLAACDPAAPRPEDDAPWLADKPVGRELV